MRFGEQWDPADFVEMEQMLRSHSSEIAAVILEPVVQGAGGMRFTIRSISGNCVVCDELEYILFFDEGCHRILAHRQDVCLGTRRSTA